MKKIHLTALVSTIATTSAHAHAGHSVLADAAVMGTVAITTTAITWVLAAVNPIGFQEELKLLLLPLIGSMVSCAGMFLFNTVAEHRRIVAGRSVFALLFGCMSPQLVSQASDTAHTFFLHAVPLLTGGAVFSIFYYVLSYPFVKKLYSRASSIADAVLDKAQEAARINTKEAIKEQFEESKPERIATVMEAVKSQLHEDAALLQPNLVVNVRQPLTEDPT